MSERLAINSERNMKMCPKCKHLMPMIDTCLRCMKRESDSSLGSISPHKAIFGTQLDKQPDELIEEIWKGLPKACHFTITQNGEPLSPNSQFGLNVRWGLANACRDAGVEDMLALSLSDRIAIGKICERENRRMEKIGVVVQLRLRPADAV